jgi:hypothetical protein
MYGRSEAGTLVAADGAAAPIALAVVKCQQQLWCVLLSVLGKVLPTLHLN